MTTDAAATRKGYRLPWLIVPGLGTDVFRGVGRPIARDARAMVGRIKPAPRVIGVRNVPRTGPFVLVANHYEGPGLWIGWTAALLTHAVARARGGRTPLHWLVIAEMDRGRVGGWKKWLPATGWAFGRVAQVWGLAQMPRPEAPAAARAAALRRLIRLVSPSPAGRGEPAGFFPEGEGDGVGGLRPVGPAAGELLALLARRGVPSLPAAVWHDGDRLTARIGTAWLPEAGPAASEAVMGRIAALLPEPMRGPYAAAAVRHEGGA